jgi:hypothetical protein
MMRLLPSSLREDWLRLRREANGVPNRVEALGNRLAIESPSEIQGEYQAAPSMGPRWFAASARNWAGAVQIRPRNVG